MGLTSKIPEGMIPALEIGVRTFHSRGFCAAAHVHKTNPLELEDREMLGPLRKTLEEAEHDAWKLSQALRDRMLKSGVTAHLVSAETVN